MPEPSFRSASGLRPITAFVGILCVLLAVAIQSAVISLAQEGRQPADLRTQVDPRPTFRMLDRDGRPLGMSIECFDLSISPQATWRAHTPDYMAGRIAQLLPSVSAEELLPRMLGVDALPDAPGCFRVRAPELLLFDEATAGRLMRWIRTGPSQARRSRKLEGLHLVRHAVHERYTLEWEPAILLSREQRARHDERCADRPSLWTGWLLDELAGFVDREALSAKIERELGRMPTARQLRSLLRDRIWAELMPGRYRVVAQRIDPVAARALDDLLKREAVSSTLR